MEEKAVLHGREIFWDVCLMVWLYKDTNEPISPQPIDILEYFKYVHLPEKLRVVSKPFCELAHQVNKMLGCPREKQVALRKLLESKDAAVRARLAIE